MDVAAGTARRVGTPGQGRAFCGLQAHLLPAEVEDRAVRARTSHERRGMHAQDGGRKVHALLQRRGGHERLVPAPHVSKARIMHTRFQNGMSWS